MLNKLSVSQVVVLAVASAVLVSPRAQSQPGTMVEWPYVGADQAHTKFSTAAQVTLDNVNQLEIAWEWEPGELPLQEYGTRPGSFEATPLMIDNILYITTMYTRVVALDAETGEELWAFDPRAYEGGRVGRLGRLRGASSTGGLPYTGEGTICASSSTAATGCTQSMPRAVSSCRRLATTVRCF